MKRLSVLSMAVVWAWSCPLSAQEMPEPRYEGKPVGYWMEKFQKAETDEERDENAQALIAFGPDCEPVVAELVRMLDDRSYTYRERVKGILVACGPGAKSQVPTLVRWLKDGTAHDEGMVIEVLGAVGPDAKEAIPELLKAFQTGPYAPTPCQALLKVGASAEVVLPAVREMIQSRKKSFLIYYPGEREILAAVAEHYGEPAISMLRELLDGEHPVACCATASALEGLGETAEPAIPDLRGLLTHTDPDVRFATARALWRLKGDTVVVPVLAKLLEENELVEPCCKLLGEIGSGAKAALPALIKHAERASPSWSYDAQRAIDRIQGPPMPPVSPIIGIPPQ